MKKVERFFLLWIGCTILLMILSPIMLSYSMGASPTDMSWLNFTGHHCSGLEIYYLMFFTPLFLLFLVFFGIIGLLSSLLIFGVAYLVKYVRNFKFTKNV